MSSTYLIHKQAQIFWWASPVCIGLRTSESRAKSSQTNNEQRMEY